MTFPVVPVVPDRAHRPLPRLLIIALGVGAITFVAGLQFVGEPAGQTAALAEASALPTEPASASPETTHPASATLYPPASPGSSRFVRTFDPIELITAVPGGAGCVGGRAGSQIAPGPYTNDTFVKRWIAFCPIARAKQDAFLRQVLGAVAPVDRPSSGEAGPMAVSAYEEGGLVGSITVAMSEAVGGIEIAVTVEEQQGSFASASAQGRGVDGPSTTQTADPAAALP